MSLVLKILREDYLLSFSHFALLYVTTVFSTKLHNKTTQENNTRRLHKKTTQENYTRELHKKTLHNKILNNKTLPCDFSDTLPRIDAIIASHLFKIQVMHSFVIYLGYCYCLRLINFNKYQIIFFIQFWIRSSRENYLNSDVDSNSYICNAGRDRCNRPYRISWKR